MFAFLNVYGCIACVYIFALHAKRPELELQTVVSHQWVVLRLKPRFSRRATSAFNCWAFSVAYCCWFAITVLCECRCVGCCGIVWRVEDNCVESALPQSTCVFCRGNSGCMLYSLSCFFGPTVCVFEKLPQARLGCDCMVKPLPNM